MSETPQEIIWRLEQQCIELRGAAERMAESAQVVTDWYGDTIRVKPLRQAVEAFRKSVPKS